MCEVFSAVMKNAAGVVARLRAERQFFLGIAVALALVVCTGFAPSFYLQSLYVGARPLTQLVWVHGFAFSLWIMLLIGQTLLISTQRADLHRRMDTHRPRFRRIDRSSAMCNPC